MSQGRLQESVPPVGADRLGERADEIYAALMKAHEGLSDADSMRLNARLVLLMMNQIGEPALLHGIFAEARKGLNKQTD